MAEGALDLECEDGAMPRDTVAGMAFGELDGVVVTGTQYAN